MADKDFLIKYDEDMEENILRRYVGKDKIVKIPEGVTDIDKFAFANDVEPNNSIEKIILPSSVLTIKDNAFSYCTKLKEIQFNEEVESFGLNLVTGCKSLKKLVIPPRVTSIICIERDSTNLEIVVNDNLSSVSEGAFDIYNEELDKFDNFTNEVMLNNSVYKIIDGFMVNTKTMTCLYRIDKSETTARIPEGIEVIGGHVFDELGIIKHPDKQIEKVIIPNTVKRIDAFAFESCEKLASVIYEGNAANLDIDEDAFSACKNYTEHSVLVTCNDTEIKHEKHSKRITHIMLERFRVIHRAIRSGQYPNTEKLRQACRDELGLDNKISIATISRDIEYLRNSMEAPIEYDRYQNGYYYTEEFELKL